MHHHSNQNPKGVLSKLQNKWPITHIGFCWVFQYIISLPIPLIHTSKIQNGRHFWGGENFLKIAKITFLRYPVGRKFRRNRSISHGLGDMSTFSFFSTQNSQLLIYLINDSLIYEAIPPKSNPIQAINPMNLHTKFQKDRLNSIP